MIVGLKAVGYLTAVLAVTLVIFPLVKWAVGNVVDSILK